MPLPEDLYAELDRRLAPVDAARAAAFPGERTTRTYAFSGSRCPPRRSG